MALASNTPWSGNTIRLSDVATFFATENKNSSVCKHASINKWARYKPIGTLSNSEVTLNDSYDTVSEVRFRSGFKFYDITALSQMFNNNGTIKKQTFEAYSVGKCRLGDFRHYYHNAFTPVTSSNFDSEVTGELCKNYNNDRLSYVINFVRSTDSATSLYFQYCLGLQSLGLTGYKLGLVFCKKGTTILKARFAGNAEPLLSSAGVMTNGIVIANTAVKNLEDATYYVYPILYDGSRSITPVDGDISLMSDDDTLGSITGIDGYSYSINYLYTFPCLDYYKPYEVLVYSVKVTSVDVVARKVGTNVTFSLNYKCTSLKDIPCTVTIKLRLNPDTFGDYAQLHEINAVFEGQTISYAQDNYNVLTLTTAFSSALTDGTIYYCEVTIATSSTRYTYSETFGSDNSLRLTITN